MIAGILAFIAIVGFLMVDFLASREHSRQSEILQGIIDRQAVEIKRLTDTCLQIQGKPYVFGEVAPIKLAPRSPGAFRFKPNPPYPGERKEA